jgi:hypothetical protein
MCAQSSPKPYEAAAAADTVVATTVRELTTKAIGFYEPEVEDKTFTSGESTPFMTTRSQLSSTFRRPSSSFNVAAKQPPSSPTASVHIRLFYPFRKHLSLQSLRQYHTTLVGGTDRDASTTEQIVNEKKRSIGCEYLQDVFAAHFYYLQSKLGSILSILLIGQCLLLSADLLFV